MKYTKLKLALGIMAGILLSGGVVTMAISQTNSDDKLTPQKIAKQAQDTYAMLSSYGDNGTVVLEAGGTITKITFNIRLQRPIFYRVDWSKEGSATDQGVAWSDGSENFFAMGTAEQKTMQDMQMALASATGVSGQAASTIPGTFFNQNWGDVLSVPASGKSELKMESDSKIGDVDCYVISSVIDTAKMRAEGNLPGNMGKMGTATTTTRLWIGKQDHLIHQVQTSLDVASVVPAQMSDTDIKTILEKQNKPTTPEAIAAMRIGLETAMKRAQNMMMKSGKIIFTETHENISLDEKFSASDFQKAR